MCQTAQKRANDYSDPEEHALCTILKFFYKLIPPWIRLFKFSEVIMLLESIVDINLNVTPCQILKDDRAVFVSTKCIRKFFPRSTREADFNTRRDGQASHCLNKTELVSLILVQTIDEETELRG